MKKRYYDRVKSECYYNQFYLYTIALSVVQTSVAAVRTPYVISYSSEGYMRLIQLPVLSIRKLVAGAPVIVGGDLAILCVSSGLE